VVQKGLNAIYCLLMQEVNYRNYMVEPKFRRDDMDFTTHDTPTGLNEWLAKIYNHLTPSGSS